MEIIAEQPRCLVGLVGAGIRFSLTPAMHEREGDALGLRYLYQTIDLHALGFTPDAAVDLVACARKLGFAGLNITHPCKRIVAAHLDELSPDARLLGSVNTVVFENEVAVGYNTDAIGFRSNFERGLPGASLNHVVVLGAGGAGATVCSVLLQLGAESVTVVDTLGEAAHALVQTMGRRFNDGRCAAATLERLPVAIRSASGVINATPVGMVGHPGTPFDPGLLSAHHWVADVVYRPLQTELLTAARDRGCRTLDGGGMAVFQAVDSFRLFARLEPDPIRMFGHFSQLAVLAGEAPAGAWWSGLVEKV